MAVGTPSPKAAKLTPAAEGARAALLFALVGDRLNVYYDTGRWLPVREGAQRAADWAARGGRRIPAGELGDLLVESVDMAREMADTLSRQAGLYTAHEMHEALDPNYRSDIADALMDECRARIARLDAGPGAPA